MVAAVCMCVGVPNHAWHLSLFTVCPSVVFFLLITEFLRMGYLVLAHTHTHGRTRPALDSRQQLAGRDASTYADP